MELTAAAQGLNAFFFGYDSALLGALHMTPQEAAERTETQTAVRSALSALTDEHRQVLLLRYMQEMDYGEIAVALDISEGTVKSRINRAKARLKELLSGGGNLSAVISVKTAGEEGQK